MCSLSMALMGLTTGLSAVGTYQQSRAQASALEAQSVAAQNAADAAYQNAEIERKKGEIEAENDAKEERRLRNKAALIEGQNKAAAGAYGISSYVGSPLDVYLSSEDELQNDLITALQNQRDKQWGSITNVTNFNNQGHAYTAQAHNYQAQADATRDAGLFDTGLTILGGASYMSGMKTGSNKTNTKTWVGNVPLSVHKKTGAGTGRFYN